MAGQVPFSFADGKDPDAFRTIGEVAQAFGIKQHVLRYWEEQFPMLKPLTRAGGRRYYRPADVALIAEINRLLYHEGFTIRGAKQALGGKSVRPAPVLDERPGEEAVRTPEPTVSGGDTLARIGAVRDTLAEALRDGQ